jgi:hypothetical protein
MIMNHRFIRFAIGFTAIAALAAGSVLVWAFNKPMVPSLYRPERSKCGSTG